MKEILEYKLFEIGEYSLSVYSIVLAVLVYLLTRGVVALFGKLFGRMASRRNIDEGRQHSFRLLFEYLIWTISIITILTLLGIKLTLVLASSAALLVGLGLGLQQGFSDMLSGIILLFEGTIEKGDIIEVDGVVGRIEEIHLRTTKFRNRDDQVMIIPNHKFVNDNVINWSHDDFVARFGVPIGVSYNSDLQQVKQILLNCAHSNPHVVTDMTGKIPSVRLDNFGDSSVDFTLLFYSSNMFRIETTKSDLRFAIWEAFRQHGVEIPFPQRDLHLKTGQWSLSPS
ncbi:MAG: mechanosensitive ion channel [Lewinellaceae bacterium]|nr:mechanosensitive ion channel [Lewinellaceae bacterium]